MAGIGFELKRLFNKRSIFSNFVGMLYSVFVTIGHMLLIILILIALNWIIRLRGVGYEDKEIFSCAILYAFIFPLILTSGPAMLISRYIADMMYNKNYSAIRPCMFGLLASTTLISGVLGAVFYIISPLEILFKLSAYILYMEVGILFLLMVYISAIKEFKRIAYSFFLGTIVTVLLGFIFININIIKDITALLIAVDIGFLIIIVGLSSSIIIFFRQTDNKYFDFLKYIKLHPKLLLTNFFYSMGLYSHNFVFWIYSPLQTFAGRTYLYSTDYDMASFVAMLTILPVTVMFVVRTETVFYDYYKKYLITVTSGTFLDIETARKDMMQALGQELLYVIEVQLIISLLMITLGTTVLPFMGLSWTSIDIFPFLAGGFYFSFLMFITITLLLYFNNQADAVKIAVLFFALNAMYSWLTVKLGKEYYGWGMIVAGLFSLAIGIERLTATLNRINYIVFCNQTLTPRKDITRFEKFVEILDK